MSFHPGIASSFNETKTRSHSLSPQSGMCAFCAADCPGTCEIGLSAVLGAQSVYPTTTGNNQIASEKDYPLDYSHFNINGRVFGARGVPAEADQAAIFNVRLERTLGRRHPVKIALPVLLPALLKMNWQDYFAGAAMAGVCCVIGEGSPSKDPALKMRNGKIAEFPYLNEIMDAFRRYYRGYGQIVPQANFEEDAQGLPEYAVSNCGAEAIEFKFGQSAKGTQPVTRLKDYAAALQKKEAGALGKLSVEIVGKEHDMNYKKVMRYLRLNSLVPELLDKVDDKKMGFMPAVELSYIKPKNQRLIAVSIDGEQASPSLAQAKRLRELDKEGKLNGDVIDGILSQEKKEVDKVIINSAELEKYFGKEVTPAKMKEQIMSLLDDWKEKQPPELAKAPKKQELDK